MPDSAVAGFSWINTFTERDCVNMWVKLSRDTSGNEVKHYLCCVCVGEVLGFLPLLVFGGELKLKTPTVVYLLSHLSGEPLWIRTVIRTKFCVRSRSELGHFFGFKQLFV